MDLPRCAVIRQNFPRRALGDVQAAVQEALRNIGAPEARVFGDIGCYTLAAQEPLSAIHGVVEMGASIRGKPGGYWVWGRCSGVHNSAIPRPRAKDWDRIT